MSLQSPPARESNWLREADQPSADAILGGRWADSPARLSPPLSTIRKSQAYFAWRSSSAPRLAETSSLRRRGRSVRLASREINERTE